MNSAHQTNLNELRILLQRVLRYFSKIVVLPYPFTLLYQFFMISFSQKPWQYPYFSKFRKLSILTKKFKFTTLALVKNKTQKLDIIRQNQLFTVFYETHHNRVFFFLFVEKLKDIDETYCPPNKNINRWGADSFFTQRFKKLGVENKNKN